MGNKFSTSDESFHNIHNDFELAIKASKKLEWKLQNEFHAEGKGLHEKITSVENKLSIPIIKRLRYIASVRNKLIHDHNVNQLSDRDTFRKEYFQTLKDLDEIKSMANKKEEPNHCLIC